MALAITTSYFGAVSVSGSPLNSLAMRWRSAALGATSALSTPIRSAAMPPATSVSFTQRWAATLSTKTMCPHVRFASTRSARASNLGDEASFTWSAFFHE